MREIKFRAWDKVKKEWILGKEPFNIIGEVTVFDMVKQYSLGHLNDIEVMQFTGLLDKNGKEIYEGDIIKTIGEIGTVIYNAPSFMAIGVEQNIFDIVDDYFIGCEVIGNVYENKELING